MYLPSKVVVDVVHVKGTDIEEREDRREYRSWEVKITGYWTKGIAMIT